MTDAEYEKIKSHCDALFTKWTDHLWLHHWQIIYRYEREGIKDYATANGKDGTAVMMDCTPNWKYMQALIRIDCMSALDVMNDKRPHEVEETAIHELLHCVLDELQVLPKHKDHEEHVASHLERALMGMVKKPTRGKR